MIAEAIDTAITLAWALWWWTVTLATVGAVLALAAIACGAWGIRALWRRSVGPSWKRGRIRARIYAARRRGRTSARTRPLWSHAQPLNYEEAA